jgi:hypothetical protein
MNESKELLEATIKGLEEKVNQLNSDLTIKKKELEDVNKPEMEAWMYDEIHGLVEDGIGEFDFSDSDNYEFEPTLDYDNRIAIGSIEINSTSYIVEEIMNKIDKYFKIKAKDENSAQ